MSSTLPKVMRALHAWFKFRPEPKITLSMFSQYGHACLRSRKSLETPTSLRSCMGPKWIPSGYNETSTFILSTYSILTKLRECWAWPNSHTPIYCTPIAAWAPTKFTSERIGVKDPWIWRCWSTRDMTLTIFWQFMTAWDKTCSSKPRRWTWPSETSCTTSKSPATRSHFQMPNYSVTKPNRHTWFLKPSSRTRRRSSRQLRPSSQKLILSPWSMMRILMILSARTICMRLFRSLKIWRSTKDKNWVKRPESKKLSGPCRSKVYQV